MLKTQFIDNQPVHVREQFRFALAESVALNGLAVTKRSIPNDDLESVVGSVELEAPENDDDELVE